MIREWEGGHREEIRLSEHEASRVVQVIMELQRARRVGDRASDGDGPRPVNAEQFGANRNLMAAEITKLLPCVRAAR